MYTDAHLKKFVVGGKEAGIFSSYGPITFLKVSFCLFSRYGSLTFLKISFV